jgi:hypothetical protein
MKKYTYVEPGFRAPNRVEAIVRFFLVSRFFIKDGLNNFK